MIWKNITNQTMYTLHNNTVSVHNTQEQPNLK